MGFKDRCQSVHLGSHPVRVALAEIARYLFDPPEDLGDQVVVALEFFQDGTELGDLRGEHREHAAVFARMVPGHG
jgi:hypothetical protein